MANKKMLIDSSHPEETRVAVIEGSRLNEFDFESSTRRRLRGNIYLAKVTRVEPSLQAAFVDYGGNRHGFLAFSEIHPDYYQIPVADREALLQEEHRLNREINTEDNIQSESESDSEDEGAQSAKQSDDTLDKSKRRGQGQRAGARRPDDSAQDAYQDTPQQTSLQKAEHADGDAPKPKKRRGRPRKKPDIAEASIDRDEIFGDAADNENIEDQQTDISATKQAEQRPESDNIHPVRTEQDDPSFTESAQPAPQEDLDEKDLALPHENIEAVGVDDALEEVPVRHRVRAKNYKIQEVIKRRQIILVQVVKEERGNKGAALTTYLSLAGRYSVLMPNSDRGGGISRKITNISDRKRLKQIAHELDIARGMGVILRTAGAARTKIEIRRDFEYLLRLWENVRSLTLESEAPALVYEEGSLIKRTIRDLYSKDIDEILVSGEQGYREAKDFMRMLIPSHARNVKEYKADKPIFSKFRVENELDSMFSPRVTLKSGGYLIINPTEALVSIDVNSGKATRESCIESTALQTNLEAAAEVARQLKLRDMAGLIVIDFIDMEENRNNRAVERRLKECLKTDRARIQVGRISSFGLLEMSRQRLRSGVLEDSTNTCPHCQGTGLIRSTESMALQILRAAEEQLQTRATHDVMIKASQEVALYLLNSKRVGLSRLENRFGVHIQVSVLPGGLASAYAIERIKTNNEDRHNRRTHVDITSHAPAADATQENNPDIRTRNSDDAESNGRRRRRRRGGRNREDNDVAFENGRDVSGAATNDMSEADYKGSIANIGQQEQEQSIQESSSSASADEEAVPKKRRGRRGGRKRRTDAQSRSAAQDNSTSQHDKAYQAETEKESAPATKTTQQADNAGQDAAPEITKPVSNEIIVSSSSETEKKDSGKKAGWWQRNVMGR